MTAKRIDRTKDPLVTLASALIGQIKDSLGEVLTKPARAEEYVALALKRLLDGDDDKARKLREELTIHLVKVSSQVPRKPKNEDLLTTEEAAKLLGRSRPWVAMLIDSNALAGTIVSPGGHRKVPRASVLQWIRENAEEGGSSDYRLAGIESGIYAKSEATVLAALKHID